MLASPTLAQLPPLVETLHEPFLDPSNEFGHSIAAGDVNGDGFADVVVGADQATSAGLFAAGEAFVFMGAGLSTVLALSEPTPETRAKFGHRRWA